MARVQLRITASGLYTLETENYRDAWNEQSADDLEEGEESPEMPESFAIEAFQTDLEEGNIGLDDVLESGDIDAKKV